MNLKERILLKLHLFLNLKYANSFFDILRDINDIIIEDEKEKKEKIFGSGSLKEKKSKNIFFCFNEILKLMKEKKIYKNYSFTKLEFLYLKNKAKLYYKKLNLIGIEVKKRTEYLIEYYIKLCKIELKKNSQDKINEEPKKRTNKKLFSTIRKRNLDFHLEKKITIENKKNNNNDELEEENNLEVEDNKNIINLFIGKLDIKKFIQRKQIIKLKKGGFINAFIFKDSENYENHNNKILKFISPKKKTNKRKIISPVKNYLQQKNYSSKNILEKKRNNKNKINNNLNSDDSDNDLNQKLLIEKKLNNLTDNKRKFNSDYNLSSFINDKKYDLITRNKKKIFLSQTSFIHSKIKNKKKNSFFNFKTESSKKNLPYINSSKDIIKKNNLRSLSTVNFLSKNDLYY